MISYKEYFYTKSYNVKYTRKQKKAIKHNLKVINQIIEQISDDIHNTALECKANESTLNAEGFDYYITRELNLIDKLTALQDTVYIDECLLDADSVKLLLMEL